MLCDFGNSSTPEVVPELKLRKLVSMQSKDQLPLSKRLVRKRQEGTLKDNRKRRVSVVIDPVSQVEKILTAEDIDDIFAWTFMRYPIGVSHLLFYILWAPFGVVLVLCRAILLVLFLALMYCLPNSVSDVATPVLLINVIMPFCGIFVYGKGKEHFKNIESPYVIAGNHMSNCESSCSSVASLDLRHMSTLSSRFHLVYLASFLSSTMVPFPSLQCTVDPFLMNVLERTSTLVGTGNMASIWHLCSQAGLIRSGGIICTSPYGTREEKAACRDSILEALDREKTGYSPLLIYPEGTVTNSRVALLLYQKFVFSLGKTVVPVAVTIWNPWPYEHFWM